MRTLVKVGINAAAIWVAAAMFDGITLADGFTTNSSKLLTALVIGALFGVVNTLVRPAAKFVGLPFLVLTPASNLPKEAVPLQTIMLPRVRPADPGPRRPGPSWEPDRLPSGPPRRCDGATALPRRREGGAVPPR